ncbi:MAG: hypothetical protein JXO51_00575 [Candidatus Aminicenantes bacterium]|nr:hypothetical protein [Candidatus Aminicenantes bacterium]
MKTLGMIYFLGVINKFFQNQLQTRSIVIPPAVFIRSRKSTWISGNCIPEKGLCHGANFRRKPLSSQAKTSRSSPCTKPDRPSSLPAALPSNH